MKLAELIEKLKTFPQNDFCKFYCPVDKSFHYAHSFRVEYEIIIIDLSNKEALSYFSIIECLQYILNLNRFNIHKPIIFCSGLNHSEYYEVVNSETGT